VADGRLQTRSGKKKPDKLFPRTLIALNVSQPDTTDYAPPSAHKNSCNRSIMGLFLDLLIAGLLMLWMIMIGLLALGTIENVLFSKTRTQQKK
jgi:hypothetical protein